MFWGVRLQPGRKYSQEVSHSYQITKAVLETPVDGSNKGQNKRVHVMLMHDDEEFVLATLDNNNVERNMDILFSEGEQVCLYLKGEGTVHLTGYIVDFGDSDEEEDYEEEENPFVSADEFAKAAAKRGLTQNGSISDAKKAKLMDEDEDEDDEEEDADFLGALDEEYDSMDDEMDEMDDEEDLSEEDDEVVVAPPPKKVNGAAAKPAKQEQKTPQNQKQQQQPQSQKKAQQTPQQQKQQQQQQQQSNKKGQQAKQTPQQPQVKKAQESAKKGVFTPPAKFVNHTKTPDGLEVYDTVNGTGPVAKKGKTVFVKYIGKLSNNKEFDRATNKPFSFRLGAGEVIQGWDKGIDGMKVGGKRRLFIPPRMAYGNERTGPIPANSHLDFEVELVRVA